MSDCFILLCAGKSKRFKSKINKQFYIYKNRPLFEYSLKTAIDSNLFKKILIVSDRKIKKINYKKAFKNNYEDMLARKPDLEKIYNLTKYKPIYNLDDMLKKIIEVKKLQKK